MKDHGARQHAKTEFKLCSESIRKYFFIFQKSYMDT
jgi:hypothetical protein